MDDHILLLRQHCKMDLHVGSCRIRGSSKTASLGATVLVPGCGPCLITLTGSGDAIPSRGLHSGLHVTGESEDRPFQLACAEFSVKAVSPVRQEHGWGTASPANGPLTISYGAEGTAVRVVAEINNFDFEYGNVRTEASSSLPRTDHNRLRVEAGGRVVEFVGRPDREQLRQLVTAGTMPTTSFVRFTFDTWEGATEKALSDYAYDIASLCSYVAGQHTGVPVLSIVGADGRVLKRIVGNPIESEFRSTCGLNSHVPDGVPRVFRQCFEEHVRMQRSALPWHQFPSYWASIQDPPYLEQKFASLMMALEFFMKNSLLETAAHPKREEVEAMQLPKLIGCCRNLLRWDIPKHYTAGEMVGLLRNAVMHGGELPTKDSAQFRNAFDRWNLFLFRRLLMRLGYDGRVCSPCGEFAASSPVNDFSEEHNTFP